MEVIYNVKNKINTKELKIDNKLKDIITKKLLRVIINLENNTSMTLKNT